MIYDSRFAGMCEVCKTYHTFNCELEIEDKTRRICLECMKSGRALEHYRKKTVGERIKLWIISKKKSRN